MAFTETPKEKEKRLAYYAKNKSVADDKEAKAAAEDLRKFNETTKVDTSENTNAMGDTYKKGGKVKKYNDGGKIYSEERERDYPISTRAAKMGDAAVEDMLDVNFDTAHNARESVGKFAKGLGRYALAAGIYTPGMAVDAVKKAFKKDAKKSEGMKKGGSVSSASKRADGCCVKGKTRGQLK